MQPRYLGASYEVMGWRRDMGSANACQRSVSSYGALWAMRTRSAAWRWHTRTMRASSIGLHENRFPTDMRKKTPRETPDGEVNNEASHRLHRVGRGGLARRSRR